NQKRRSMGIRRPPFMTVDYPFVTIAARSRAQHGRIAADTRRRLGHRESGIDLSRGKRAEPLFALVGIGIFVQQVEVALVGRGTSHRQRAEEAAARRLEYRNNLGQAET